MKYFDFVGEALKIARSESVADADAALRRAYAAGLAAGLGPTSPPVYCKHCPFSRHVHYEVDGKLVTPSCPGFEPDIPDQGGGH